MRTTWLWLALAACHKESDPDKDPTKNDTDTQTTPPPPTDFCDDLADGVWCDGDTAVTCAGGEITAAEGCDTCVEGDGCFDAELFEISVPGSNAAELTTTGVIVEVAPFGVAPFAEERLRMREIVVQSGGPVTVALTGDLHAFDAAGAEITELPAGISSVFVAADHPATGAITLTSAVGETTLPLTSRLFPGLSGRPLLVAPWFEPITAFNDGDSLSVALDPSRFPDRIGQTFDVAVVPHRSRAEWVTDPTFGDAVLVGSGSVVPGSIADDTWDVGPMPVGADPSTGYDIVFDFDRNGQLNPGDLLDGGETDGAVSVMDLTTPGPYTPTSFEYSTGVWTTMVVYTPEDPNLLADPMPLVVISHGNGHDYTWYDYLGNFLASWGYVVISHTNNTGPGIDTASTTTLQNTETFLRDLPILGGGMLDGHVDKDTIAWIGHSRGGEGVVHAYNKLVNDVGAQPAQFDESDIVFISSIAPTMFQGVNETNPHDRPYHIISGSRDGDVTGGVQGGSVTQYYTIFQPGTGQHLVTYVHGADHNDFNCCGSNDANWTTGPGEIIGRSRAQAVAKSYLLLLLDRYVRDDERGFDYLWRTPDNFKPLSAEANLATMFRPAHTDPRTVLDDFQLENDPTIASSGATVIATGIDDLVEGPLDDKNTELDWYVNDPMNGMTWSNSDPIKERGIVFTADAGDSLEWVLASEQDWSNQGHLSFRACEGTRHPLSKAPTSFLVTLTDAAGVSATIDFGAYGQIPAPYARTGEGSGTGWVNEFQTVRIRLTDFEVDGTGLDLTRITSAKLTFGNPDLTGQRIGLDDLLVTP